MFSEKPSELAISSEQQLNQLTDFVSFLENWNWRLLMLRDVVKNIDSVQCPCHLGLHGTRDWLKIHDVKMPDVKMQDTQSVLYTKGCTT